MDVLTLLETQIRCLEKALKASADFMESLPGSGLTGLDRFESKRNSVFKAIELFDRNLTEAALEVQKNSPVLSDDFKAKLRNALERREKKLGELQRIDGKILDMLQAEALTLSKEINSTKKSKDILSKFKSQNGPQSGNEVDQSL